MLTAFWGQSGRFASTFRAFWVEFLVGPVKYWLLRLSGNLSADVRHPMSGASTWVYCVCLSLILTHLMRPRLLTGCVSTAAFVVWYGWAFLTLNAFEY